MLTVEPEFQVDFGTLVARWSRVEDSVTASVSQRLSRTLQDTPWPRHTSVQRPVRRTRAFSVL